MNPRDRRALRIGGAILAMAILALRVMPWTWSTSRREYQRLIMLRAYVADGQAELERSPETKDSAQLLTAAIASLTPRLLKGTSPSEATAAFEGYLQQLGLANAARLERVEATPDSARAGSLRRASVDAVFETDVRGLAGLLGALARGELLAEVTQMRITGAEPEAPLAGPEVLRVSLRVRAWYVGDEGA